MREETGTFPERGQDRPTLRNPPAPLIGLAAKRSTDAGASDRLQRKGLCNPPGPIVAVPSVQHAASRTPGVFDPPGMHSSTAWQDANLASANLSGATLSGFSLRAEADPDLAGRYQAILAGAGCGSPNHIAAVGASTQYAIDVPADCRRLL